MKLSESIQVVAIVYCSIFLNFVLVGATAPLIPRILADLGLPESDRAIILAAKSFSHMASSVFIAFLSPKLRMEYLFVVGIFCVSGAFVGFALSSSVAGFVASRAVQGLGVASIMVAGMSIIMRTVQREKRGRYSSFAYSAIGHALLLSPLLSGLMYTYLGQMWTFLIPGIGTVVCGLVAILLFSRLKRERPTGDTGLVPMKDVWIAFKRVLKFPLTLVAFVGIFTGGLSLGCIEVTVPKLLIDWPGLSVIQVNLIWSIGALVFTLMAPAVGFGVDRLGGFSVFTSGLFVYAVIFPLMQVIDHSLVGIGAIIALVLIAEAFLEYAVYPVLTGIADSRNAEKARSVAFAFIEVSIQAGFATGNLLGAVLFEWNGLLGVGVPVGGWDFFIGALALASLLFFRKRGLSGTDVAPPASPSQAV